MGMYRVPLDTPLGRIHAVLDTGAQISYAPRRAVAALEPCGVAKDFYPMLGEFEVELYELRIRLAGRSIVAKMGVLPPILEGLLSAVGSEWILGTDVLRQRSFQLDLAHNRMIAHTPAPVEGGGGFPLLLRLLADEERRRERAEARVVTSPVTGWRGWRLVRNASGRPILRSMTRDTDWPGPVQSSDRSPLARGGRSGIHCYATPGGLGRLFDAVVYGEISLSGIVCVHETGYRGERATIDRLYLRACGIDQGNVHAEYCGCRALGDDDWLQPDALQEMAESLSRTYQCDVIVDRDRPRGYCRVHRPAHYTRRPGHVADRQVDRSDSRRVRRDPFTGADMR
jgi:hypothetical protein